MHGVDVVHCVCVAVARAALLGCLLSSLVLARVEGVVLVCLALALERQLAGLVPLQMFAGFEGGVANIATIRTGVCVDAHHMVTQQIDLGH